MKKETSSKYEIEHALLVIDNWRSSHAYPLHVIHTYFRRNSKENVIVAERLKRLDSIISKLSRFPDMSLWRIQDLGECRIIVKTNDDVFNTANSFESSRKRHVFKSPYDYIENPKEFGYRSLHCFYEYKSDDKNSAYNRNMLVDVQYRTQLQHLWATSVETMRIFTKQSLKSSIGKSDDKRFFALISSLLSLEENKPIVPNTINNKNELIQEIEYLNNKYKYLDKLSAVKVAINNHEQLNNLNKPGFLY